MSLDLEYSKEQGSDRFMVQEIIVVEGKDDVEALKRAVNCECVITHGHGFSPTFLDELEEIQRRRGLIIFTDPDYAGNRIRERIRQAVPDAKHAYLDQKEALKAGDIGVENASPEMIREALKKAKAGLAIKRREFTNEDLVRYGLAAQSGSKERRIRLAGRLGIGYGNAKQLLAKLNDYDVTRQEFEDLMQEIMGGEDGRTG